MDFSDIGGTQENNDCNEIVDTNGLFEGQLIRIDETPNQESWKLVPLFSDSVLGDTRVWQIGYDHTNNNLKTVYGIIVTTKGQAGENLQTSYHPVKVNNSGRSLKDQALLEARRRYLNKIL